MQRSLFHLLHGLVLAGAFLLGWVQEVRADGAGAPPLELVSELDAEEPSGVPSELLTTGGDGVDPSRLCEGRSDQLSRALRVIRTCQHADHTDGRPSARGLMLLCGGFTSAP